MSNSIYKWPLAISPFSIADRLKIAWWIISQDRFTMGKKVAELEDKFSELSGRHALMVSSGSTANQLVFELWKLNNPDVKPLVIVPAVTWVSSVSPAIMAGFDIKFCDIDMRTFSLDVPRLSDILRANTDRKVIIWPTALIGFAPPMEEYHELARKHGNAEVFLDACENTLSVYSDDGTSILASADIVTTSTYLSHYVCSVEGGFVFFKNKADYDKAKMFRNHGMTRSLPESNYVRKGYEAFYSDVDSRFLFAFPGTNLRNSDVHASFGLADFKNIDKQRKHRMEIYKRFYDSLDPVKYYLPKWSCEDVAFCLPIIAYNANTIKNVKQMLEKRGIESRPIIGGNLLRQPAFERVKGNDKPEHFPNADFLHYNGVYVGLHHKVTNEMIDELTKSLNLL